MSLVEVKNVIHSYNNGPTVLHGINLEVKERDVVALVGESGCGKTTLGRMIAGLHAPSQGEIDYQGRDIWSLKGRDKKAWRREVQMVHQDPYGSLNPGLTIGSSIAPGLLVHKLANHNNVTDVMVQLMERVGLDATPQFLQRYPHQLSGGQRQRASIARAISLNPQLVVADEVTSMLDVSMRVAILDLLLSFQEERGLGFVFISHDFGVVRYFAQGGRIAVMFFGFIVEFGPTEQVITAPKHPYTSLLLNAIPVPDPVAVREREAAKQDLPEAGKLIREPSKVGCVFVNRCPLARDRCRTERPPLVDQGGGHQAACFYSDEVPPLNNLAKD